MDMDSTLLAIESIDEIADMHGMKPQVAEITQRTMRGEIVFEESLRQRTALLQGLEEEALQQVYDSRVRLSPGAEKMLQRMKSAGLKTMVISGALPFSPKESRQGWISIMPPQTRLKSRTENLPARVLGKIVGAEGKAEALKKVPKNSVWGGSR